MATRLYDALTNRGDHEIGSLNTKWTVHMTNGAILDENVENYTMVEVFYTDDELHCKQLSDVTKKGYLVTTVEEDQLMEGEEYVDFYNAKDEIIRITDVDVQKNSRFETSAISFNTGVTEPEVGNVAHFDPTSKTYLISKANSAHADYETAVNKFEVVDEDSAFGYAFDKLTVRLMSK